MMKYKHTDGALVLKFTDDSVVGVDFIVSLFLFTRSNFLFYHIQCLQYKTETQQDLKKIDRFMTNLMRHMVSTDK